MVPQVPHPSDGDDVLAAVRTFAAEAAAERHDRQRSRRLRRDDFDRLAAAGVVRTGLPRAEGGLFDDAERSIRPLCDILRTIASGDASLALVVAMHPSVLYVGGWLSEAQVEGPHREAWARQRRDVLDGVRDGHWWGTITSEPGSGGDIANTRAVAVSDGTGGWRLTGRKHFGSGSGITSFMLTTAVPKGEDGPDLFYLDMRDASWDGSRGIELIDEWDGHGMIATQSHALSFDDVPVVRSARPGAVARMGELNRGFVPTLFAAVVVGIVETAMREARSRLGARKDTLDAFERVEWVRCLRDAWLIDQAFEGMLRGTERSGGRHAILAKTAIAELAEEATTRLCRVMGGGSYARHSPFGFWAQDVRALGFLRPPWALAHDGIYGDAWASEA